MPTQAFFSYPAQQVPKHIALREGPRRAIRAVDLHLHSRYAARVSERMVLKNIVPCAWVKGLDVLATGDCLQSDWLDEIGRQLIETGSGLLALRPEFEESCAPTLPARFRRPLHFLLSTEVSCVPPGARYAQGHHHLIYFRSLESVRRFREKMVGHGNLGRGRPALRLTSQELLEQVLAHGEGTELAPAHIVSPIFSSLGSTSNARTLRDVLGDLATHVLAIEMGPTAIPPMCRRLSSLDGHTLFANSDAHSLEKIGREYTLLEIEPTYDSVMAALRAPARASLRHCVKVPVTTVGGYWNGCEACRRIFDDPTCQRCRKPASIGSRAQVEAIADRAAADAPNDTAFQQLLPLKVLLAGMMQVKEITQEVRRLYWHLLTELGHERTILTSATYDELAAAHTKALARAICGQRASPPFVAGIAA